MVSIIQCIYQNETAHFQVIRVEAEQWVEKTLPPGGIHQFSADKDSYLEISTYEQASMIISDRIPCRQLEIKTPNSDLSLKSKITQERLRQAQQSFNLALSVIVVSSSIVLVGSTLLLLGKVSVGSITSAGGLVSGIQYIRFTKDAQDRLDKILDEDKD